jgi:hypothetical protein
MWLKPHTFVLEAETSKVKVPGYSLTARALCLADCTFLLVLPQWRIEAECLAAFSS